MAISAPLASSGGADTALPIIVVMITGIAGASLSFSVIARPARRRT